VAAVADGAAAQTMLDSLRYTYTGEGERRENATATTRS